MNVCIDVQDVSFTYEDAPEPALRHVSLQVHEGEFLAVLGHNGSGKSTLAKLLNALYLPTEGHITVCGMDTQSDEELWEIRQKAGMIFQNPDNQLVATVVREDVAFGLENLGIPREEMIPRIDAALQAVGMSQFAEAAPHMLSGGQMRRVAIAGVLAMEPKVLILDEPAAGLDPRGRERILGMLQELHREGGVTIVMVSHSMDDCARLATRMIVMSKGELVLTDTPRNVFRQADLMRSIGLGVPEAAELCGRLRAAGLQLPDDLFTQEELHDHLLRLWKEKQEKEAAK